MSVALGLLFLLAQPARAQFTGPASNRLGDIAQMTKGNVVAIIFEGNHALSSAELGTVVGTHVPSGLSRFLYGFPLIGHAIGSTYETLDFAILQRDTAALNQYYKNKGYLMAKSSFRVSPNHDDIMAFEDWRKKRLLVKGPPGPNESDAPVLRDTVIYTINEGPPYTIEHIAFEGLESLPNEFQPELTEHVTIKSGQQWSQAAAAGEVERLDSIMWESGYPHFKYDTIYVDNTLGTTKVNVTFIYTPGHRYRYGPVEIVYDTNSEEKTDVAARVVKAQLFTTEGQWYKLSEIQRSEQNLYRLGAFDIARVSLDTDYINKIPDSLRDSSEIPVQVFLRMKLRAEVTPGIYAGTSSRQGTVFGVTVAAQDHNLTKTSDELDLEGAWQPLPSTQQRYSANANYTLPYIGLGRVPLIFGIGASRTNQLPVGDLPAYDQKSFSTHIGSSFILSKTDNKTTLSPDFLVEYVFSQTNDQKLRDVLPPKQVNLLPTLTYQDDRSNDVLNPTSGDVLSAVAEYGIPTSISVLGSGSIKTSAYVKLVPQVKKYIDLSDSGYDVIASRLLVGGSYLFTPGDSNTYPSINHRFYSGGSSSDRGWPDRALLVTKPENSNHQPDLYGGFNTFEANFEYRYAPFRYAQAWTGWQKFTSPLRIVFFYDIGNTWDDVLWKEFPVAHTKLAQSIGFGIRYNTFVGPLRLDWGFKLYDPSGQFSNTLRPVLTTDTGKWLWNSNFGSGTWSIHFAIGQAF